MTESTSLPIETDRSTIDHGTATPRAEHRRGVRYGISLASVMLGVYLLLSWSPSMLVMQVDPLLALQLLLQLAIALAALAGGLAIAPTSLPRGFLAAALAVVLVAAANVLFYQRMTGELRVGAPFLWAFLTPGTAALLSALLGWLIVRRRPILAYPLVLASLIPAFVQYQLVLAGMPSAVNWMSTLVLTLVAGVVVAWIAAAISAALG